MLEVGREGPRHPTFFGTCCSLGQWPYWWPDQGLLGMASFMFQVSRTYSMWPFFSFVESVVGFVWIYLIFDIFVGEVFFFFFWLPWVFVAAHELSLIAATRIYSLVVVCGLLIVGLLLWQSTDSRVWAQ